MAGVAACRSDHRSIPLSAVGSCSGIRRSAGVAIFIGSAAWRKHAVVSFVDGLLATDGIHRCQQLAHDRSGWRAFGGGPADDRIRANVHYSLVAGSRDGKLGK